MAGKSQVLVEGKYPLHAVLVAAEKIVKQRTEGSFVLDPLAERRLPKLRGRELVEGNVLGEGFFCSVYEISDIVLDTTPNEQCLSARSEKWGDEFDIYNHVQDRHFMELHCRRGVNEDCRYALKRLQARTCAKVEDYINGIVDLAIEAKFLAVIQHPNIIKMRAMAYHGPYSTIDPYFIVLDRLYDTLSARIMKWRKKVPSFVLGFFGARRESKKTFWNERICVAADIASALQYLHEKHIIYRDLKGDNVGFDVRGDVKVFDFGLSKEFDPSKQTSSGMYNLTECTGSPRYMAPEVALGMPYNETADVYSFSLILWQILKLATPYNGLSSSMLNKGVYRGNVRPRIDKSWPKSIRTMIKFGWGGQFHRPSMSEMVKILRIECGLDDISEASRQENASQSFISAIKLGYASTNTKAPNVFAPVEERHVSTDDTKNLESTSDDDTEEAGRGIEAQNDVELLNYSTEEESDRPVVSFIAPEELSHLLQLDDDKSKSTPSKGISARGNMLFPFVPSRIIDE